MRHDPAPRPWYRQKKFWLPPVILLALWLLVFIGLQPVVRWQTRKRLAVFEPQMKITFKDARLSPLHLTYVLTGLKVVKQPSGSESLPYVTLERLEVGCTARSCCAGTWSRAPRSITPA